MTQFRDLIERMTPAAYDNLRRVVETGRWPDGRRISDQQRETCLQATLAWEQLNLAESEHTGRIPRPASAGAGGGCTGPAEGAAEAEAEIVAIYGDAADS